MSTYNTLKRSHGAYKGHFNIALKSFYMLIDVKPHPTKPAVENAYYKVQQRMESLFNSSEKLRSCIQSGDFEETPVDTEKELDSLNQYCESMLNDQCKVEALFATFMQEYVDSSRADPSPIVPRQPMLPPSDAQISKPTVRLTALEPPAWNGIKADFYTWRRKFVHIMAEANIFDELTQLCYLQNSKTLPLIYQTFISDCSTMGEAWSRLEERVPKETIKYEIISQLRRTQPLTPKRTPSMLRDFANEISLFCRRMADIGFSKECYSCIVMQDVYERMDLDTTLRYRSKIELKRELSGNESNVCEDLDSLSDFLRSEATTLEMTVGCSELQLTKSYPPKKFNALQDPIDVTSEFSNTKGEKQRCMLGCANLHKLVECENYLGMTVEKRHAFIRSSSRCYVCLGTYHRAQHCPRKKDNWKCRYCSENSHHWTLCLKQENENQSSFNANSPAYQPLMDGTVKEVTLANNIRAMSTASGTNFETNSRKKCSDDVKPKDYSALVLVEVKDRDGRWIKARCFLDTGSNSSLVRSKFAKDLRLYGNGPTSVEFGTAGGRIHYERAEEFEMQIRSLGREESYFILATGVKKPCFDVRPVAADILSKYKHLEEYKEGVFMDGGEVDLLIGLEYAPLIIPERIVRAPSFPDDCPSIAITRLGSYIYGSLSKSDRIVNNVISVNYISKLEEDELKLFFYGDVIGVKPTSLCVCSDHQIAESAFIKHVRKTTRINKDGRVCIEMPWKPGFPGKLPNNYHAAIGRMIRRENQLIKNGKLEHYNEEIANLVKREVVTILTPDKAKNAPHESSWYLSHRMVERPYRDTTKFRMVFDSAAVYNGVCLNDGLEKGPNYTNSLFRCFLKWRMYQVAVIGDMEKMFNQIAMAEKDQQYHRFVWRDGNSQLPASVYQWVRVLFGDKPSPDLATYAIRFLAERHRDTYPTGANILDNNTYVDDVGFSVTEDVKANQIIHEIDEILRYGKFSIKKWNSNSPNVDENPDEVMVDILGHRWNKVSDVIGMKHKSLKIENNKDFTKRNLASVVAKLWDPLGYLLPVSIKYRIDLQDIWQHGYTWDQPIDPKSVEIWKQNIMQMESLLDVDIKRCFKPTNTVGPPQLHAFSDGGDEAYGTCIFIRWPTKDGIEIVFVAAKAFVAPLKYKTTPRLELMAAVAMARLTKEIEQSVDYCFEFKNFWIDSRVVIFWLQSLSSRYKPFVACRIQEFQDCFENYKEEIKYVPSESNPADCLTKPISVNNLVSWHKGDYCEFLKLTEESWPSKLDVNKFDTDAMKPLLEEKPLPVHEVKRKRCSKREIVKKISDRNTRVMSVNKGDIESATDNLGFQLAENFSSWSYLVRSIAFLKSVLKLRTFQSEFEHTPDDINSAELRLFIICQQALNNDINRTKKRFLKHDPVYDDQGLIRAKGRLEKTHLPEEVKHPILLPGEHPLVNLYASHHHRRLLHQGYRVILSYLASVGILIGGGKELLKYIASKCIFCRIRRRKLLQQQMGILPSFRIRERKAPFTSVALDFFGNLKIKQSRNVSIKGSVMIVTCMTSRCIHLELCTTIDTNSFLRAWRRFTTRRGVHPNHVFSDGGTTFRGAHLPLLEWIDAWDHYLVKNEFERTTFDFAWKFNVPTASHMNGVVESLINSVRKGLDAAIVSYSTKVLTYEEWTTVLSEVTYIINSRPLFPNGDPDEFNCITGNNLLHPYDQPRVPQLVPEEKFNPRDTLKVVQYKVDDFWKTWIKHMPPQLNSRNKWYHPRDNLEKGDFVIVLEPGMKGAAAPRSLWKKAIVTDTNPGPDGLVRSVKIRDSNHKEYHRPIHKLCLIATRAELESDL